MINNPNTNRTVPAQIKDSLQTPHLGGLLEQVGDFLKALYRFDSSTDRSL